MIDVLHQRWMPTITLPRCATLLFLQLAQVPLEGTQCANPNRLVLVRGRLIGSQAFLCLGSPLHLHGKPQHSS